MRRLQYKLLYGSFLSILRGAVDAGLYVGEVGVFLSKVCYLRKKVADLAAQKSILIGMKKLILILIVAFALVGAQDASRPNKESRMFHKYYSFETQNFIVNYERGCEATANEVATVLERLHPIYRDKYGITLPRKTTVLVSNSAFSGGWALAIQNTIAIWVNDFDWNMRGTPNWLENVVAHEYAHIVSISASYKMPYWMPYFQVGKFSHPNSKNVAEVMAIFPSEILPPWFFEGI